MEKPPDVPSPSPSESGREPAPRDQVWLAVLAERERAVRVARARGSHVQDVEDVVQEAMARVAAMPHVDLARVGPLLTTVVANLVVDGHRGRARNLKAVRRLESERLVQEPADDDILDVAEARWLRSRLCALSAQDARVLELRAEGLSPAEAAGVLGVTLKAVDNAFTRARGRMQAVWRTTAALVSLLGIRPLRHVRGPAPAMAAVGAWAAVVALALPSAPPAAQDTGPRTRTPVTAAALDAARAGASTQAPAQRVPAAATTSQAAPAAPPPVRQQQSPRRLARAAPVDGRAGFSGGGVVVQQEQPEQSLSESVAQCLEHGLTVTLQEISCD